MAQPPLSNLRRGCWGILPNMGELVKLQRANTFRKVWHLRSLTGNNVLYPLKDRKGHSRVASLTCWCWQTLGSLCSKDKGRSGIGRGVGGPLPGKGEHSRTTAHFGQSIFYGDSAGSGQNSSLCKQLGMGWGQRSQETSWRLKDQVGFFTQSRAPETTLWATAPSGGQSVNTMGQASGRPSDDARGPR